LSCEKLFLSRLRERGLRLTPQREMVLSVLHDLDGLATAEAVFDRVREKTNAVDISTVYRTLDLLQSLAIVSRIIDPSDGQHRYELVGLHGPHFHLVCRECGAVQGLASSDAEEFAEQLLAAHGFAVDIDQLTIEGLCRTCREGQKTL